MVNVYQVVQRDNITIRKKPLARLVYSLAQVVQQKTNARAAEVDISILQIDRLASRNVSHSSQETVQANNASGKEIVSLLAPSVPMIMCAYNAQRALQLS